MPWGATIVSKQVWLFQSRLNANSIQMNPGLAYCPYMWSLYRSQALCVHATPILSDGANLYKTQDHVQQVSEQRLQKHHKSRLAQPLYECRVHFMSTRGKQTPLSVAIIRDDQGLGTIRGGFHEEGLYATVTQFMSDRVATPGLLRNQFYGRRGTGIESRLAQVANDQVLQDSSPHFPICLNPLGKPT